MRPKIGCLLLLLALAAAGCWDFEEVDRRAFATTIGIDRTEGGKIRLTVQVPLIRGGKGGAVGGGEGFVTLTQTARTVHEAFAALQTKTSGDLVIQQNKTVVLGETAARQGVKPLLDYLRRNPKAPPQSLVFIARRKSAAEILSFVPPKEILPASELILAGQTVPKADRVYFIPLWRFVQKLVHRSKDPYAPLIDLDRTHETFILAGIGVFAGDRLAGELDPLETQAFGILANLMKAGTMTFATPGGMITLRNVKGRTRIRVNTEGGRPSFRIETTLTAAIGEDTSGKRGLGPADYRRFEREAACALKPRLVVVIRKLQRWGADVIDLGEELRIKQPQLWERIKGSWREIYRTTPVEVKVKVHITLDGVLQ